MALVGKLNTVGKHNVVAYWRVISTYNNNNNFISVSNLLDVFAISGYSSRLGIWIVLVITRILLYQGSVPYIFLL